MKEYGGSLIRDCKDNWTVKELYQPPVSAEKQKTRRCIFTFGLPVNDARIKNKKPGAFCSLECREGQMDLDVFEKEIAKATSVRLQIAGKLFTKDVHKLGFHC
uniref:Uncharacterized protein n=1 Tax=Manihot esculenta TaxID=3983 RepID=A0A2C9W8G8_MANES